jgi:hypothetical protein
MTWQNKLSRLFWLHFQTITVAVARTNFWRLTQYWYYLVLSRVIMELVADFHKHFMIVTYGFGT